MITRGSWEFWRSPRFPKDFVEEHKPLNAAFAPMMAFSVAAGVAILFCMHWSFINRNETTVEYGELNMFGNPFKSRESSGNVAQILGPEASRWFIPILPGKEYYDKKTKKMVPNESYVDGMDWPTF